MDTRGTNERSGLHRCGCGLLWLPLGVSFDTGPGGVHSPEGCDGKWLAIMERVRAKREKDYMESGHDFSKYWMSQFAQPTPNPGPTACYRACRQMAHDMGFEFPESTENRIQLAAAEFEHGEIAPTGSFNVARDYLSSRLAVGKPCIVGIHYKMGSGNRDGITDHFNLLCSVGPGGILVGLNPGAGIGTDSYNAAFLEDPVNQVWRAIKPTGLKASMSMIVLATGESI